MQQQEKFQILQEQRHFFGRRPDARSRGRVTSVAGSGVAAGNTTDVIGQGATVTDVIATNSVGDVIQVGA